MIKAINAAVTTPKTFKPVQPVAKITRQNKEIEKKTIDEKQNDEVLFHLDYIGKQLKTILDVKAGKPVKVEKSFNKLPEDEMKTPAQKQKDEAIIELGYIGNVLKKMADVESGKPVEELKPDKSTKRVRI